VAASSRLIVATCTDAILARSVWLIGEEEGRLTYLWLIVLVFPFMLYGLYTWGVYPFE